MLKVLYVDDDKDNREGELFEAPKVKASCVMI